MIVVVVVVKMISTWTEAMSAAVLSTRYWFFTTAFFNLNDCFFKILFECFFINCILCQQTSVGITLG